MTDLAPAPGTAAAFPAGESSRIRADFPILSRTVRDDRALVYLDSGATSQQAGAGAGRRARVLRAAQRRGAPWGAPARRGGHRRLRVRPRHGRRVHRRACPRGRVHQERHGGPQPGRLRVQQRRRRRGDGRRRAGGGTPLPPGSRRRHRRHRDGAPRQPRAVAGARPPHRRDAALVAGDRRRPAGPHRPGHARDPSAPRSSPSPTCPTCSGPSTRSPRWCSGPGRSAP